jgi:hypothetical protein
LPLPDSPETAIFYAFSKVLQSDPVFFPVTEYFVDWTDDDKATQELTHSRCPYCMIKPFPTESTWVTEQQHDSPLMIHVTLAVKGLSVKNLMNYWHAMRRALFPQTVAAENAVQTIFANATVGLGGVMTKPTLQLSGYGPQTVEEGLRVLVAEATIRFGTLIKT